MIETTGNDLVVIASNPMELAEGQQALIVNICQKEVEQKQKMERAAAVFIAAEEAGIATADAKKLLKRAENRAAYLGKVAAALEAGYVMVPNFGRILDRSRKHSADNAPRMLTFLIAWFQDTAAI